MNATMLLITKSVSYLLAPSNIRTRYYNVRLDTSLDMLSYIVDKVYRECHFDTTTDITLERLGEIKLSILFGSYSFSPLVIQYTDRGRHLRDILLENFMDYPDVKMESSYSDTTHYRVVTPKKLEDVLVFKSLAMTIITLLYKSGLRESYDDLSVVDLIPSFYDRVLQHGRTSIIYKIYLNPSIETIPISVVEQQIKLLLGNYIVSKLLLSFLHLPIYNEDGKQISIGGIPSVGELSKALYHMTLMGTLDREFPIRFPEYGYTRLLCEAYLFDTSETLDHIDKKAVHKLLSELSLIGGTIESIRPGYNALKLGRYKQIYLESDGVVKVCDDGSYDGKTSHEYYPPYSYYYIKK